VAELRRLFRYLLPYWKQMLVATLALVVSSLIVLALPWAISLLVDSVFGAGDAQLLNWIAAGLLALTLLSERRTTLGRALKAVGAGEPAAAASGLNVARYKILAFAISGALAAIAGLLFSVKLSGGAPTIANGFLWPAIVAVLVGGTPLTGGVGGG